MLGCTRFAHYGWACGFCKYHARLRGCRKPCHALEKKPKAKMEKSKPQSQVEIATEAKWAVEGKIIQSRIIWQSQKVEKRAAEDWEFLEKRFHPILLLPPPHIYFDKTFNLYCFSHWFSSSCFLHFLVFVFSFVASLVCLWLNNSWGWGSQELLRWSHTALWSNRIRCWCQVVDVIIWHSFGYKRQKTKVCKNRQPRSRYTVALIMWAVGCAGGSARMSQKFPSAAKLLAADASKKAGEED